MSEHDVALDALRADLIDSIELNVARVRRWRRTKAWDDSTARRSRVNYGDAVRCLIAQVRALDAVRRERDATSPCVCTIVTPCADGCTCVKPYSSRGCRRCAKYGSAEQRRGKAEWLASVIDDAAGKRGADAKR